jgi:hypothetical protein
MQPSAVAYHARAWPACMTHAVTIFDRMTKQPTAKIHRLPPRVYHQFCTDLHRKVEDLGISIGS